ncbi:MAG: exodeoxyribonuclease V subunit gamma [Actinobacteria bacterium]|nr:exodeoxyribonuclease V subunit gamma [Actinomycetota bacterium]MBW3650749.1 exodeoxyribonuclease V subunit gamma [Actinomycetota bacterium]
MLHIHRAERADRLVEALGDVLVRPLADPMEAEVVAVPTRGVERWLTQRLASRLGAGSHRGDGICANVEFPFPGRLVGGAVSIAAGVDHQGDPWTPERSVWALLEVLDGCLDQPWLGVLAAHLGRRAAEDGGAGGARRFTSARRIADLYDRYGVHRPEMLRSWAVGDDTDGNGAELSADASWQAELWRRLRGQIGQPSPAERLEVACSRLGSEPTLVALPQRISLFGLTRLPASYLQVLTALAHQREVHLFLLHPSPVLWSRVAETLSGDRHPPVLRRQDDATARLPRNRLLASWGRDAREMQLVLSAGAVADDHRPVDEAATTLLQRIQADVRADREPPGVPLQGSQDRRPSLDPHDRSLQVHACHGRARQVEVVRDAILHLLAEDPSIEARDVIVMCPDIEAFAPLIHATFGAGEVDDGDETDQQLPDHLRPPDLRVRLADRSLRQTNPVLAVVSELLELASARVTAAQVLDLAGREPVRRRFQLDDDDLARLEEWVVATGIRWGLDAAHRAPFKLDALDANTWRAGVDRVLVGVAMAEEDQRLVGGVLPLDDVDSGSIDLAGRVAELVDRVQVALGALAGPLPLEGWAGAIATAADLLTATSEGDGWQRAQLQRLLDEVVSESVSGGEAQGTQLTLGEVRALLADRLRGRPTRANFRTGHLTICTLVPMRSVPHRVVCLLGLDDGTFPRQIAQDGDDLVAGDPRVGDRDARSEDRQLLLDALLAATDRLVITYTGRDERTNAPRPPAVPVGELLEVVTRTVRTETPEGETGDARDQVVVRHPLQPFDPRNFSPGHLVPARAWSFDGVALAGARAMGADRARRPPFLVGPLPAVVDELVEIDRLVRFLQHPVRAFLRERLGISVADHNQELSEAMPVELDELEKWQVGQHLLEARLAGADEDACVAAERARGNLAPGALADPVLDVVRRNVESLLLAAHELGTGETRSLDVRVALPDGRLLVGTVAGLVGSVLRAVNYSRLGPKHRLAGWARFLALAAAHPDEPLEVATVGRARQEARSRAVSVARLRPFPGTAAARRDRALAQLVDLVSLYDRGMCEPLPLYCATSAAHAAAVAAGKDATAAARKLWESEWERDREDKDLEHQLVLGGVRTFAEVVEVPPCEGEAGAGWEGGEASRFGRYSRRLWDSLLAAEELADR